MSDCTTACMGKGPEHGHLTICRPRFTEYIVRARRPYARRYEIIKRTKSERVAFRVLAETMQNRRYKRADVLGDEGPGSYYEPTLLVEMTR